MTLKQLEAFILEMVPAEQVLKKESTRVSRNPIFNATVEAIDKLDLDCGDGQCTSTNLLLALYTEKD